MANIFARRIFRVALVMIITAGLARAQSYQSQPSTIQEQQRLALEVVDGWVTFLDEKPKVFVTLNKQSAVEFLRFTKVHLGQVVEVVIDGRVTLSPRIMEPIAGGSFWIGYFATVEEANSMLRKLITHESQLAIRSMAPNSN